ncbi:MAG: DUF2249 domain-containing protein [Polyangiaceae bacterium]|nr:DUF2249 domain-containing protein [Polyangiaceae bacterium]MCW5792446.1 DUF2249 domain-containing protein [Polyangiaceae bacterium]
MTGSAKPVTASDRVASVLARDEALIDVFESLSPAFKLLRNPLRRKTMAKLVTLSQAARIAGVDAAELVSRLNQALGLGVWQVTEPLSAAPALRSAASRPGVPPPGLLETPPERRVELDVHEALNAGEEPLRLILAAAKALPRGSVLLLRAPFEPVPLFGVLAKQGFAHYTEQLGAQDWRAWFYRDLAALTAGAAAPRPMDNLPNDVLSEADDVIILDVRGLEPPEPMELTLTALASLPRGKVLIQINERVPRFLIPRLKERGFSYEVHEQQPGVVRLFIRHAE